MPDSVVVILRRFSGAVNLMLPNDNAIIIKIYYINKYIE